MKAGSTTAARLDVVLVQRGLARSRRSAAEMVAQGRVRVAGSVAEKSSLPVREPELVEVEESDADAYVSRAAHKLLGALEAVARLGGHVPVEGAVCLDAGASTGGFTQVLLERGAARVLAVDVGHGQLAPVVAGDPRVISWVGVNVRDLLAEDLPGGRPRVVVADLSFISLTLVTSALLGLTAPGGHLLLMVKPQFEVGRERLGSSGVVTSAALRQESVLRVARSAAAAGAVVRGVLPSPLPGPAGNHEYFVWLSAGDGRSTRSAGDPSEPSRRLADGSEAALEAVVEGAAAVEAVVEGAAAVEAGVEGAAAVEAVEAEAALEAAVRAAVVDGTASLLLPQSGTARAETVEP